MKDLVEKKARTRKRGRQPQDPRRPVKETLPAEVKKTTSESTETAVQHQQYPHIIGVRINAVAYMVAQEALLSAHAVGDYKYSSMPDLLRAALRSYFKTREFSAVAQPGQKKKTTIGLDDGLKRLYEKLPPRKRGEIIERALRTFLKNGMR